MNNFKELRVWQATMDIAFHVYQVTNSFPKDENFGLTHQLRDAVISVPSNISEGFANDSRKEFSHFLSIAQGSLAEVETQLLIANRLQYVKEDTFNIISEEIESTAKQLRALRVSVQKVSEITTKMNQEPRTKH